MSAPRSPQPGIAPDAANNGKWLRTTGGAFSWEAIDPKGLGAYGVDEFISSHRTADCFTVPWIFATFTTTPGSGTVYGVLARAKYGGAFTRMRYAVLTAFNALTDCRVGVYDLSLPNPAKVSESASLAANLAGGVYVATLGTTVNLAAGDWSYLTFAAVGQASGGIKGGTFSTAAASQIVGPSGFVPSRIQGGWTPGALPANLSSAGGSGNLPWLELLP